MATIKDLKAAEAANKALLARIAELEAAQTQGARVELTQYEGKPMLTITGGNFRITSLSLAKCEVLAKFNENLLKFVATKGKSI